MKRNALLLTVIFLPFTSLRIESAISRRHELVSALQKHFSSGCVVWQLLHEDIHGILQRKWEILQLQTFLSRTNVLSTVVGTGVANTTIPCQRNRPLYLIWWRGDNDGQHLRQLFSQLHPSDARWLLFRDNASLSTEDLLRDINIPFDCEFLVVADSQEVLELTEVYRVHYTLPVLTSLWGRWSRDDGLTAPALGLIRRRNDLRGIDFIVAGVHEPPMVYLSNEDADGNVKATGYQAGLWNELSKRLNFRLITRPSADNAFGSQLANGSWNGIMRMVLDGTANSSLSFLSITETRSDFVDFTAPVFLLWIDIFIRMRYDSDDSWGIYLSPFTSFLWLSVAGCILLITCFLVIMYHLLPERDASRLQDTFFSVLGCFSSQGIDPFPRRPSHRLALWTALITGYIVHSSYEARIISSLAVRRPVIPFSTHEGLLQDKSYGFGYDGRSGLGQMYKESPGVRRELYYHKILPNLHQLPMSHLEGFQRACDEKYAYMCGRTFAQPEAMPCQLTKLPHASTPLQTAFILPKRSPFRRIINYTLRKMMGSGVYRKLYLQWLVFPFSKGPPPMEGVYLRDVAILLLLCTGGVLVSLCVVMIEITISRGGYLWRSR